MSKSKKASKRPYKQQIRSANQLLGQLQSRCDRIAELIQAGQVNAEQVNYEDARANLEKAWTFMNAGKASECETSAKRGLACLTTR